MKTYTYTFSDGTINKTEVNDDLYAILKELDRKEKNSNKRETRRHISLDYLNGFGIDVEAPDSDPLAILIESAKKIKKPGKKVKTALSELSPQQHKLLNDVYIKKLPMVELADQEGVSDGVIRQRMFRIISHLRNILL